MLVKTTPFCTKGEKFTWAKAHWGHSIATSVPRGKTSLFILLFCYCFLTKNKWGRHMQKERGSDSSKVTFLCLYPLPIKTRREQRLPCPGMSPAKQTLPAVPALGSCGDLSPWAQWQGHARSACLDTSVSSLSTKAVTPISPAFFFFFS